VIVDHFGVTAEPPAAFPGRGRRADQQKAIAAPVLMECHAAPINCRQV
jgi:hypothetical protein